MSQTLEAFVRQNDVCLEVKKMEERSFPVNLKRRGEKQRAGSVNRTWVYDLTPPVLARTMRVHRGGDTVRLLPCRGTTRREAREKLLRCIRGGVLEYSNGFDRECGSDPKIWVPKNLR
jgi:hypothetical protein